MRDFRQKMDWVRSGYGAMRSQEEQPGRTLPAVGSPLSFRRLVANTAVTLSTSLRRSITLQFDRWTVDTMELDWRSGRPRKLVMPRPRAWPASDFGLGDGLFWAVSSPNTVNLAVGRIEQLKRKFVSEEHPASVVEGRADSVIHEVRRFFLCAVVNF